MWFRCSMTTRWLATLAKLRHWWQLSGTIGGLACTPLYTTMWRTVASVSSTRSIGPPLILLIHLIIHSTLCLMLNGLDYWYPSFLGLWLYSGHGGPWPYERDDFTSLQQNDHCRTSGRITTRTSLQTIWTSRWIHLWLGIVTGMKNPRGWDPGSYGVGVWVGHPKSNPNPYPSYGDRTENWIPIDYSFFFNIILKLNQHDQYKTLKLKYKLIL